MIGQEIGAARNGLNHRNAASFCKLGQLGHGLGILHPTTGDDRRAFGSFQGSNRILKLARIWHLLTNAVHFGFKERQRVIIGPTLHILWQSDKRRAAIGRIKQSRQSRRQGLDHLRRMGDPVPIATNRLKTVIEPKRRIAKMLQLLQHWIGQSGQKRISAKHQHRQAVGMAQGRCGQ